MVELYRRVEIESEEPIAFVGVHPIAWHRHPEQSTCGFAPMEEDEVAEWLRQRGWCCEKHQTAQHNFYFTPKPLTLLQRII